MPPLRTFWPFLLLLGALPAFAGEVDKKIIVPLEPEDRWRFALSVPGWAAGVDGDFGVNGKTIHGDFTAGDLIPHLDMVASIRAEASKGRFSFMTQWLYLALSDGIGSDTVVKKIDLQVDQAIGELGVSWRLLEGPRGSLDVIAGVRYNYLYQKVVTQANAQRINEVSTELVDEVAEGLRTAISERRLRDVVAKVLDSDFKVLEGRDPTLPIAPLLGRLGEQLRRRVQEIIDARRAELLAALQARDQATTAAQRAVAQARVDSLKKNLSKRIANALEPKLNAQASKTNDWWDPYIGLRGRYNFNDRLYLAMRGDVGGFGVGSKFAWQTEGALGWQITPTIFAEAGYRALGMDYRQNGLIYDAVLHGAQLTLGVVF